MKLQFNQAGSWSAGISFDESEKYRVMTAAEALWKCGTGGKLRILDDNERPWAYFQKLVDGAQWRFV